MSCPSPGPCLPYVTSLDLCCIITGGTLKDPCLTNGAPVPTSIVDNSIKAASELMWAYTGRQFGQCTAKIRPCKKTCGPCGEDKDWFDIRDFGTGFGSFPWVPSFDNGVWTNIRTDCGCQNSCCQVCELLLLPNPICCIDEVRINGTVLGPSLYRVDNFKSLVRTSGNPVIQSLATATGPVGGPLVAGPVSVSGLGAVVSTSSAGNTGVELPTTGTYTATFTSPSRKDVAFELEIPVGFGGDFNVFGIPSNAFKVVALSGVSDAQITQIGSHITVGNAIYADTPIRVSILTTQPLHNISQFSIQNNLSSNLRILNVQWSDITTAASCWPECQDLEKPDTEDNTFSITVTYGREVPELVKLATATLACEFIKACVGQPCQLPQRMTSMTRQGVTVGFLDPQQFFAQGLTGIYLVDLAVKTFNPKGLQKQAYAYSPDIAKRWRTETGELC